MLAMVLAASPLRAQTPASFPSALAAYNAGHHGSAREAFLRMARDGRADAQFNLAVMLAKGQGGQQELARAALWLTLSAEAGFSNAREPVEALNGMLDGDQRSFVENRLPQWRNDYSRDALFARHAPKFCADCESDAIDQIERPNAAALLRDGRLRVERTPPRYPRDAAADRIVGEVELGAWVSEQGRLALPHVLYSDPPATFDASAMRALKRWEFEWQVAPQERSDLYFRQTIEFTLEGLSGNRRLGRSLRHDLGKALESVEENASAAYVAASTLEFINLEVDPDHPERLIEIIALAARQGIVQAQLDLAERLAVGNRVEPDRQAGLFWLKRAAYHGDARAQFRLSMLEPRIGDSLAQDFGAEAISAGYTPALLSAIRAEMQKNESAPNRGRLQGLLDALPEGWLQDNRRDETIQQAEALVGG